MFKSKAFKIGAQLKEYLTSEVISFSLLKEILLPIFWEQLFLAYLALFSIWLLSFDGESAMSVVNMMALVNKIFTSLCLGLATGGTVLVAQNIGSKRPAAAGRCTVQVTAFAVLATTALAVFLLWVKAPFVDYLLSGASDEIILGATLYFTGFCVTFPFYAFYQSFAGAMRGWGKSALAWRLTLLVNAAELGLTALLLIGFRLGVPGVTLAMAASRILGGLYAACLMFQNRRQLELKPLKYLTPDFGILKGVLIIAAPLALEQFFFNSGRAVSQRYIAVYGTGHMTANGVVNAVFDIFNLPQITLREGLVTVVGMCIGCGRYDLARRYVYRFLRVIRKLLIYLTPVTVALSVLLAACYRLAPQVNLLVFYCLAAIYITGPFLLGGALSIPAGLRAGGDAAFVSFATLGSMWAVRVGLSWFFAGVMGMGVFGINLAMIFDWLARGLLFRQRLRGEAWYSRKLIMEDAI